MIIKFLEIFTEYLSIVFCIHKVAGKKYRIGWCNLFDFACWIILVFVGESISFGKLIPYAYLFVYIKVRVSDTWKQAVKPFAVTMCAIPMLQLSLYVVISYGMSEVFNVYLVGMVVNILIIIFFHIWKNKYLLVLVNMVTKFRRTLFFILLFFLIKCLISYFSEYKMINAYFIEQMIICFLIIMLMLILWVNSENEKRHKAEELRTYQIYTKTFENAIAAIRMKQHEFDNHINAIRCMQYTIHNTDELIIEQNKYCNKILQDNKFNKLLKLNMSPILVGYLYSKFTAASMHGINIDYEIQDANIECIVINDLIEIIGILFDNAVEALEDQGDKEIEIRLLGMDDKFMFSIANISAWKTNSEIEKLFKFGYSTKGREHGIGLCRVNALLKKYKTCIQVENIIKNDVNFLYFKIIF